MRTKKLVAVLAGLMVLGFSVSARAVDHAEILNAVRSGDSALTQKVDGVPQNWDKTLPANDPGGPCPSNSSRFTCVMGGAAVRDNETGLVWEQSPSTAFPGGPPWYAARFGCMGVTVGGRKGWRLPSVHELASLVDPSQSILTLPTGHPFSNVLAATYWTATTPAEKPALAWVVNFSNGTMGTGSKTLSYLYAWCVRGATTADQN